MPPLGQRRSDRTGDYLVLPDWSPSTPDLYGCPGSRETLARPAVSREMRGPMPLEVSDALASATYGDLCVSPPGHRRRPSATGRGDRPRTPSSSRAAGTRSDNAQTDRWPAPLSRRNAIHGSRSSSTSSRSATRGTTSLADFPGCAKSPSLEP